MTAALLRFGTRRSPLARWQTDHVAALLTAALPSVGVEVISFDTEGDRRLDVPLPEVGGKGLFTEALEQALRERRIDAAVHSLKDLPTADAPGLTLGAVLSRADVRDALVSPRYGTLMDLPEGAVVGTSSVRRAAQLHRLRPDLVVRSIRGNVGTRLQKVDDGHYDAALFALAGLDRLGLRARATDVLPLSTMLPAPGQGALGVQCRAASGALPVLALVDDADVRASTGAERSFLSALGGGCSAPVGAYAAVTNGHVYLRACVFAGDGSDAIDVEGTDTVQEAEALGRRLAEEALRQGAARFVAPRLAEEGPLL